MLQNGEGSTRARTLKTPTKKFGDTVQMSAVGLMAHYVVSTKQESTKAQVNGQAPKASIRPDHDVEASDDEHGFPF